MLDGVPSTKVITVEAFRIDGLLAARKGLTPTCSRSEAGMIFALSSYASSTGTRRVLGSLTFFRTVRVCVEVLQRGLVRSGASPAVEWGRVPCSVDMP